MSKSYLEKLKDVRWQKRRLDVFKDANWKCEEPRCPKIDNSLEAHHCHYIKGREPWEYDRDLLMALCPSCHAQRQSIEIAIHIAIAQILRFVPISRIHKVAMRLIAEALQECAT